MSADFIYSDGGREAAGYRGTANDCVVRAIATAAEVNYQEVYDAINILGKGERATKRHLGHSTSRDGVYKITARRYIKSLGWQWTPTMKIGSGCRVHLRADELPAGRLIAVLSKHYTAVIDGVVHDTHDPTRNGTRCVYGYFSPIAIESNAGAPTP